MKSKALAIALIVLGIGATLGGLYGQIFLGEDEGHHDGRDVTFALESVRGADELVVTSEQDNQVSVEVLRAGQPIGFGDVHDGGMHLFVVDDDLTYFEHVAVLATQGPVSLDAPRGEVRVVAQLAPSGGPDFLELGATAAVNGEILEQNISDTDVWTNGDVAVQRQNFDFVLSEEWNGNDVYDGPAFLTLFRAEDFSFTHAHAEVVDGNRFSFAATLPGRGDFLAALEFEQNGEFVTALFRFTL